MCTTLSLSLISYAPSAFSSLVTSELIKCRALSCDSLLVLNGRSVQVAASAKLTGHLLGGLVFYLGG
jgi:hypothetical protein